jgi:hypothetical protein
MAAKGQSGGGGLGGGGMRGGGSVGRSGKTSKPKSNVTDITTKKTLTDAEIKKRAAAAKKAAAKKAAAIPADRADYGPVQKWGMNPPKPAPKPVPKPPAPAKRTLAADTKKVVKSPKTKAAGTAVAVGLGYSKLRANDKAQQQKMINLRNQWNKSAAKKAGMTLNDYIKKYGK